MTYVYVYDSTPEVVYVGYYPGYTGSYLYNGCVVYGTGWYYRPWHGRYYYPRYRTWGIQRALEPVVRLELRFRDDHRAFHFWYRLRRLGPPRLVGATRLSRLSTRLQSRLAPRLSKREPRRVPKRLQVRAT